MKPILIVDDEVAIAQLIAMTLARMGYTCQMAFDGLKAAELLEKNEYDLVLLDIMLPGADGYELIDFIRPTGIPVIFISAKTTVADRVKGLHLGACDYIVKPFAPEELLARVENVLRLSGRGAGTAAGRRCNGGRGNPSGEKSRAGGGAHPHRVPSAAGAAAQQEHCPLSGHPV